MQDARILVLPVPYDSTTSYKTGAREGPAAIIDASTNMELFDHELRRETSDIGIHTLSEVAPVMSGPKPMVDRLQAIASDLIQNGQFLCTLGGEHLLSVAPAWAHAERYSDLTVLQFDAHADMREQYAETGYNHACTARRILERSPVVQVGIRSLSKDEWDFLQTGPPVTTFWAEQLPLSEADLDRLVDALSGHVYLTFDLDAFDPGVISGVGTPEPGGLTWSEALRILRRVARDRRVVGFDLMEYCPAEGNTSGAFTAAKLAYKLMGYCTEE
jgi:N1-aminopropylagmatine ureohydrolase